MVRSDEILCIVVAMAVHNYHVGLKRWFNDQLFIDNLCCTLKSKSRLMITCLKLTKLLLTTYKANTNVLTATN